VSLRGRLHLLRQAAESRPNDWRALAGLAEIELWGEEPIYGPEVPLVQKPQERERAVENLERALRLAPESEKAALHCRLALAHLSFAQWRTVRRTVPGKPDRWVFIWVVRLPARHAKPVKEYLAAASRLEPRNGAYDLLLASALFAEKKRQPAVRAVQRGVQKSTFSLHERQAAERVVHLCRAAGIPLAEAQMLGMRIAFTVSQASRWMRQIARDLGDMGDEARKRGDHDEALRLYLLGAAAGRTVEANHRSGVCVLIGSTMEAIGLGRIPLTQAQEEKFQRLVTQRPRSRHGHEATRMRLQNFMEYAARHGYGHKAEQAARHVSVMLDFSTVWRAVFEPRIRPVSIAFVREAILRFGGTAVLFQALCFFVLLLATLRRVLRGDAAHRPVLSLVCAAALLAEPAYLGWVAASLKPMPPHGWLSLGARGTLLFAVAPVVFVLALGILWSLVSKQATRIFAGIALTALAVLSLAYLALVVPAGAYRAQLVNHGAKMLEVGDAPDIAKVLARLQADR